MKLIISEEFQDFYKLFSHRSRHVVFKHLCQLSLQQNLTLDYINYIVDRNRVCAPMIDLN